MTRQNLEQLAARRNCPRCMQNKTLGMALCRRCRFQLPPQMRWPLEHITAKDEGIVYGALRAAVHFFDVHYRSVRDFGGGRPR